MPSPFALGSKCSRYKDTLTPGQARFLDVGEPIGEGARACVYESNKDKGTVLKLTNDPLDAYALDAMRGSWAVPKVHGVYELLDKDHQRQKFYAVQVERVDLPTEDEKKYLRLFEQMMWKYDLNVVPDEPDPKYTIRKDIKQRIKGSCADAAYSGQFPQTLVKKCEKFIGGATDAYEEISKRAISFTDVHTGNWGVRKGKPIAIDLGFSNAKPRELEQLEGMRSKKMRRRRRHYRLGADPMGPGVPDSEAKKDYTGPIIGVAVFGLALLLFFKAPIITKAP